MDRQWDMPLVNKIVEIVYKATCSQSIEFLQKVYEFVKDYRIFQMARDKLINIGLQAANDYLWSHREELIEYCRKHKDHISSFVALPTRVIVKGTVSKVGVKAAIRLGAKTTSRGVKALAKVGNPASLAVDVVQTGLEVTGHKEAGMTVGFLGNVGVGAVAGFACAGPLGAFIGGVTGLGSWFLGEVAGEAVDNTLS